jgi:hypothetical protein
MSRDSPRRKPQGPQLKFTPNAPVMIIRDKRPLQLFAYTDEQWVQVVSAKTRALWPPESNLDRVRAELEAAGQQYRVVVTRVLRHALNQARELVALARALQFSKVEIDALRAAAAVFEAKLASPDSHRTARATLVQAAINVWLNAANETKVSRAGPAVRFLKAALEPILGEGAMISEETLYQAIRREQARQ